MLVVVVVLLAVAGAFQAPQQPVRAETRVWREPESFEANRVAARTRRLSYVSERATKRRSLLDAQQLMYRRQREKDRRRPLPVTRSLASISEGEWYEGIVQKTRENGAFVSIGAEVDGFVHAKDISDSEFVDARTLRRGEALSVCVKFVDVDRKVLSLSAIPYERTDAYLSATNSKGLMDFAIDVKVHNATIIRTTKYAAFVDIGAKVPAYLHYADIGLEPRMRVGGPREPILQPRPGLQIDECWIKDIEFARHRVRITTIPPDLRDDPHINPPPKPEYLKYLQYQQHRDSPPHPDDDYHYF